MCTQKHTGRPHFTQEDRAVIEALRTQGAKIRVIAGVIHKHYSSVSRELRRNSPASGTYTARSAQKQCAMRRLQSKFASRIIENDAVLERYVEEKLRGTHTRGDWSPAIIANDCKQVCHQTIYSWIIRSRKDLRPLLPRQGKYRRKYGLRNTPSRRWTTKIRSIETRPEEVAERATLGHFEGDTVLLGRLFRLLTLVDRKSKFLIAELLSEGVGIAYSVHEAIVARFSKIPITHRKTLTPDRGSEFAYWDMTEEGVEGLTIYFAHAHSPWERGTNEQTNGLIRRYFPKNEKHDTITLAQVADVVWMINHRPRRSLNWETPCRVFGECCSSR